MTTYDDALSARNDASETRDIGVNRFNAEEYSEAINRFESARSGYANATDSFTEASDLAAELTEEEAASICETSAQETAIQVDATEAALAAATAAEEGAEASTINDHVEEFQNLEAEANELTVEDTEVLAEALGLQ